MASLRIKPAPLAAAPAGGAAPALPVASPQAEQYRGYIDRLVKLIPTEA